MSAEFLVATVTRGLAYLALAALIGSLAVDRYVLPGGGLELHDERRRLRQLRILCIVVLVMTSVAEVVLRGRTMTGAGFPAVLRAVPVILGHTHFGHIWFIRFTLLAGALCVVGSRARVARAASLVMALGVAFTTAVTGHAGDWGDVSPSAAVDFVHVMASSLWVGGLLALAILGSRSVSRWPPAKFRMIARRFSRLAGWSLLAVVLSGSYNAWIQVATPSGMWTTAYGRVLSIKLAIVLVLMWFGAVSRYTIVARLADRGGHGLGARVFRLGRLALFGTRRVAHALLPSHFLRYVSREALLGIGVFACTAVLVDSSPARHAAHLGHQAVSAPAHITMEGLHEGGGIPKGWIFTPPPGDARHGRSVFARLACFSCHTVAGEGFPPPTAQGPDLTDVGAHHPSGYLFESILNPDAVVVQAPGYTDTQGRSIMPDYRGSLSVVDLVDLVAYLATLTGEQRKGSSSR
jgi:putative copper resistance protein D